MTTYEIVPETEIKGYDLGETVPQTSISTCRRMCNDNRDCEAFVWSDINEGTCSLKSNATVLRNWNENSTLYIKKENSSYWLLWMFLAILGIMVFLILCGRKKR
jgi:hypothetical protein